MVAQSWAAPATLRKVFAIALVCTLGTNAPELVQGADKDQPGTGPRSLAAVLAAWKARQERVESLHFTWEYRLTLPKGYRFPDGPVVGGLKAAGVHIKSEDVHYTMPSSEVWAEGADRFRDEFSMVTCMDPNDWKPSERFSLTTNGPKYTRSKIAIGTDERPQVAVWNELAATRSGDLQLLARANDSAPLLLTFRPFRRAFGWNPERCRLVSESELVGDTRCVTVQMDDYTHSGRCWVDPDRDYVIVKWEKRQPKMPSVTMSIDYQNDKVHGWIPVRWKRQLPGTNADATGTAEAVVTRYAVNKPLPKSTFEPAFPPGTPIADLSAHPLPPKGAAAHKPPKVRRKPAYDPFAEPQKDLDAALKTAKEQNKRVLIDFGANWCGDCSALAEVFHGDAEVSAALKPGFVLVLIDYENPTGRQLYERYNPARQVGIPHLTVLDSDGNVLKSEASEFAVGHYDVPNLKAFIAKWSRANSARKD